APGPQRRLENFGDAMATIRDTLVTVRRLLLLAGWALALAELAFGDGNDTEARCQWLRAREALRAQIVEQRARSNEATRTENVALAIPPSDKGGRPNYVAGQLIVQ